MARNRHSAIAPEGVPVLLASAAAIVAGFYWVGWPAALLFAVLLVAGFALFRDPVRALPAEPAAVLAPCDGRVLEITRTTESVLDREATLIRLRVNPFGAYTVRSPVEGLILDPRDNAAAGSRLAGFSGLWVRTDAKDDVVTLLQGPPIVGVPKAFVRYGERTGQGQRIAYLRLAREARVYLPNDVLVRVAEGQSVRAGSTEIARFRYD